MTGRLSFFFVMSCTLIFVACKKSDNNDSTITPDECVTGRSSRDGEVIEGRYIVSYKSSAVNARTMTSARIADIGRSTLEKHRINAASLEQSFAGEPGGFVAKLTTDEVTRLKNDETIDIIEPDRIIALSTCFTVVEPKTITWSVNRTGYGDGTGKTAWIIDSGIDFDHPDLDWSTFRSG